MWDLCLSLFLCIRLYQTSPVPSRLVQHILDDLRPVECVGVQCSAGTQLSFCKRNRTSDYCHHCPAGSSQPLHVDSRSVREQKDIQKCKRTNIACPPEAAPIQENGRTIDCECDTSRGYVGKNYMLCLKYEKCPPGTAFQMQSGLCSPCLAGSFNQDWNYEPCKTHTNCTQFTRETISFGNSTEDSVCGEMFEPDVITSPVLPTRAAFRDMVKYQRSSKQGEAIYEDSAKDHTSLKHPQDSLMIETEWNRYSILTTAILVLGVAVFIQTLLLTIVVRKLCKEKPTNARLSMKLCERRTTAGEDKPGIQAQDDDNGAGMALVASDIGDEGTLWQHDAEQPGTIYPQINAVPCTPTAPSMTPSVNM